ncbi:MAG: zf-HC2 domain-containing protein [Bacteroidota bacterium]|nr:zf-HC2 domain-containing protein [Bacteroidota bacterium]
MTNNESNFLIDYSKFLDDSGKHLSYASFSVYRNFADELSQKEITFFKAHLAVCPACSARMQEVDDFEFAGTREQQGKIFGFSPNIFRYAIAAILIVAVGSAIIFVLQDFQQKKTASREILFEKPLAVIELDTTKFIPNQALENFIERTVRSSSNVTLLAPTIGDTITTPFTIKWEGQKEEKYTLTIVDNKNVEKWKKTVPSAEIILKDRLEPGLYYLKLEANEKLVQVGKFVVIR